MVQTTSPHLLALDLGDKRVGVATANTATMMASPLTTLDNDEILMVNLAKLVEEYQVQLLVIGLPRSLSGQDSAQTVKARETIDQITKELGIKTVMQDEALSSLRAEEELKSRGKIFAKADVDKLAACLILEDYIQGLGE